MDNRKTSANTPKAGQNANDQYGETRTGSRSTGKTTSGASNSTGNTRSTNCGRGK